MDNWKRELTDGDRRLIRSLIICNHGAQIQRNGNDELEIVLPGQPTSGRVIAIVTDPAPFEAAGVGTSPTRAA